jgi:hypothetical protein
MSTGRLRFRPTGELTDDTVYEYRVNLGNLQPDAVQSIRAVPAELNLSTRARCQEDSSCNLAWIQITSPAKQIEEIRTVNDFQDFSSTASSMLLPESSQEFAMQGTRLFAAAVAACATKK